MKSTPQATEYGHPCSTSKTGLQWAGDGWDQARLVEVRVQSIFSGLICGCEAFSEGFRLTLAHRPGFTWLRIGLSADSITATVEAFQAASREARRGSVLSRVSWNRRSTFWRLSFRKDRTGLSNAWERGTASVDPRLWANGLTCLTLGLVRDQDLFKLGRVTILTSRQRSHIRLSVKQPHSHSQKEGCKVRSFKIS